MDKYDVIVQAVDKLKGSQFKATAIKVELEANLGRPRSDGWGGCDCDDCQRQCPECNGAWEGERCDNQCDDGYIRCEFDGCENGYLPNDSEGDEVRCPDGCDDGWFTCEECDNEGWYSNCEYCEEGYVTTEEEHQESNFSSNKFCQEYIMERLAEYGLATYDDTKSFVTGHDGYGSHWHPQYPLTYAEFYTDGSVDSEFTFTLDLNESRSILLLPKFLDIFKEFAKEAGNSFDVGGAGMHMALINSEDCSYPTRENVTSTDMARFANFQRSLNLLMPAMFFLASHNEKSRGLNYRNPCVGNSTHRTAIDYRGGALEFRLFDTCYDNPEAILDNVVVMGNVMKYWNDRFKPIALEKITRRYLFGVENSQDLERHYITEEHFDLLNAGLRLIKPAYYTIGEVKQQRKFTKTKSFAKNAEKRRLKEAEIEYKEYENRFEWSIETQRNQTMNTLIQSHRQVTPVSKLIEEDKTKVLEELKKQADKKIEEYAQTKQPLSAYVEQKIQEFRNRRVGNYELSV